MAKINKNFYCMMIAMTFFVVATILVAYSIPWLGTMVTGLVLLLVSAIFMNFLTGLSLFRLTIPSFFWYAYCVTIFLPSIFFFYQKPDLFRDPFITAIELALFSIILGIGATTIIFKFRKSEIKKYFHLPVMMPAPSYFFWSVVIFFIFFGFILLYMAQVKVIPLFYMMNHIGDDLVLGQLRELSLKILDSPFRFLFYFLRDSLYPLMIVVSLGAFLYFRNLKWFILAGLFIVSGFIYASFSLAKFPPAAIILVIFLFLYLFFGGVISKRTAIFLLILFLLFPLAVLTFSRSNASLIDNLHSISYRIFLDPSNTLYYYFQVVPEKIDFLGGATMGKLAGLFGKEYFNLPNYVSFQINPSLQIESGSANAAFVGDLYVNFGFFGVILGSFLVGFLMQTISILISRCKKTVFNLAANAYLFLTFSLLVIMPMLSQLVYSGMPILLLILIFEQSYPSKKDGLKPTLASHIL